MSEHRKASRLATPIFSLALGIGLLLIMGRQGQWGSGVGFLAIMAAYSAVLLLMGRRNETVGLIGGDVPDERGREISLKAVAFAGYVLILVTVAMFLWELAHGRDGSPWAQLGAIGGAAFIGATAWYARRS